MIKHRDTNGSFLFEGTRRDEGLPRRETSGVLRWKAAPMADSGDRVVTAGIRLRYDGHLKNLNFDVFPPEAFGDDVAVAAGRDLVRGLGESRPDAQSELIRLIGADGKGFDIHPSEDGQHSPVRGHFPFAGKWTRPGTDRRVAGRMLWDAFGVDEQSGGWKVRLIPDAAFDLRDSAYELRRRIPTGQKVLDREFVGRLADDDWKTRSDLVKMMEWTERGFDFHALPV